MLRRRRRYRPFYWSPLPPIIKYAIRLEASLIGRREIFHKKCGIFLVMNYIELKRHSLSKGQRAENEMKLITVVYLTTKMTRTVSTTSHKSSLFQKSAPLSPSAASRPVGQLWLLRTESCRPLRLCTVLAGSHLLICIQALITADSFDSFLD